MTEIRCSGRIAAAGYAAGPIVPIVAADMAPRRAGSPDREADALRAALAAAVRDLTDEVARAADPLAAEVLGLQLALVEDPVLAEPAFDGIAGGLPADAAWRGAMDAEIEGYLTAEDDYFQARAADLSDLRDRVLGRLLGVATPGTQPAGGILVGRDLSPSRFLSIDWRRGGGIALSEGSETSHVAMLARARGVPMLVRAGLTAAVPFAGAHAIVAAGGRERSGVLVIAPGTETLREFDAHRRAAEEETALAREKMTEPARTAAGQVVKVLLNISDLAELDGLSPEICDGVGLVRTEFLFQQGSGLPGEELQYVAYRRLVDWAAGRPVTVRTLDAGGDKPIPGLTHADEANPFLGVRGLRLSLERPDVFRVQLRALARAAVHGPLRVMLPMVALPDELERARAILMSEVASLRAQGVPHDIPPLGIMVEIPAAALRAADFNAAFYSVGSNDLTQYVAAAGRDVGALAHLLDPIQPAVVDLVAMVCRAAQSRGVEASLCGDAGGDPAAIPALLAAGLRSLSMAPGLVASAKRAISRLELR